MRLIKVMLEYSHWHGGRLYPSGSVLELDEASALWLIGKGLAEGLEEPPDDNGRYDKPVYTPAAQPDAHIAGDAPHSAPEPEAAPRRVRGGKPVLTQALPPSGEGATDSPSQEIEQ